MTLFQPTSSQDLQVDEIPLHQSFSHDDMEKMFETPHKFSVADLIAGSEAVEAAMVDRPYSKSAATEYHHVDETDYASKCIRSSAVMIGRVTHNCRNTEQTFS